MSALREALNEAIEAADEDTTVPAAEEQPAAEAPADEPNTAETEPNTVGDEPKDDKDAPAAADAPDPNPEAAAEASPTDDKEGEPEDKKPENYKNNIKAPVNWGPKERQDWSRIPRNLQEKIISREKEIANNLTQTKEARTLHDRFGKLTDSYAPVLASEGVSDPMEAVEGLFQTVAVMRMGNPSQKAQMMAKLVNQYGVDIGALDEALASGGAQPPMEGQPTPPAGMEAFIDQKMAPVNQLMGMLEQMQQSKVQQSQQQAQDSVTAFASDPKNEFFNDVRGTMADLVDVAAKQGQQLSIQDAYERACQLNPEIRQIMTERQQNENLLSAANTLEGKKAAASSLSGKQAGLAGGNPGNLSLRDSIAAAWDDAGS